MYILGISAFYHDSAATVIKDGHILYAVEEERFTRIKHDNQFPSLAIEFCLKAAGISIGDIDYVAYYEKPLLKFERILENFVLTYPFSMWTFLKGMPEWLDTKIKIEHIIKKRLDYRGKIFYIPHHFSHASASFYPSPYKDAAILTVDGVGEYQTTGLWRGENNTITPKKTINFPHSLGLLYSTFTSFLGFKVNDDEYKVMGLAAYGEPIYADKIHKIIDLKEDGSFALDMKFFTFRESFRMWSKEFEKLFGVPRLASKDITRRDKDLAASIQKVTEEVYLKMLNYLYQMTGSTNLCIAGGVGLNAVANGKIYQHTPFKNVYIFGAAGDSGGAVGAALFTHHHILDKKKRYQINNLYLGSLYTNEEIRKIIEGRGMHFQIFNREEELLEKIAGLLAENKIVGWFDGKMEFGPRALGARSILANPQSAYMREEVNKIKIREQFRPFAGSILQEKVHEYFEVSQDNLVSPFMTFCFQVKEGKKRDLAAIVHHDGTCRIQTVSDENGRYYRLIKKFYAKTGIPCILNTSFNVKGEPIVESPKQALEDFLKTDMQYLVMGDFLITKN